VWLGANVAFADACDRVSCSGHGTCMLEANVPFCLCDEGYAADELRCTRVRRRRVVERGNQVGPRVLYVALSQADRSPQQVGGFDTAYELARHVAPGEMWCSEFISWVYASSGVPFTGGYEGGWLLTNNRAIRSWFQRRDLWVGAGSREWRTFEPQAGDYVRLHTQRGHGHSAVVRYVIGSTLYTVEGNVGGRVRLRTHRNFRTNRRIDGFGIIAFPDQRRAQLDREPAIAVLPRSGETRMDRGRSVARSVRDTRVLGARVRQHGVSAEPVADPGARTRANSRRRAVSPARVERPVSDRDARRRAGRREPRA
jgi:hypothetical protein